MIHYFDIITARISKEVFQLINKSVRSRIFRRAIHLGTFNMKYKTFARDVKIIGMADLMGFTAKYEHCILEEYLLSFEKTSPFPAMFRESIRRKIKSYSFNKTKSDCKEENGVETTSNNCRKSLRIAKQQSVVQTTTPRSTAVDSRRVNASSSIDDEEGTTTQQPPTREDGRKAMTKAKGRGTKSKSESKSCPQEHHQHQDQIMVQTVAKEKNQKVH